MYAKLFTSLYQGTLRGQADEILVFTNLIAHCDQYGFVDKHWRAIAEETGISEERVRAAIIALESPDPESRTQDQGGRRLIRSDEHRAWGWKVTNYAKYRAIRNEDDRREQNKIAQAKWRASQKAKKHGVTVSEISRVSQDKPMQKQYAEAERKTVGTDVPPLFLDHPEFVRAWDAWKAHRKALRKPITPQAAELQLKKCKVWGADKSVKIIYHAIEKGWTGLYEFDDKFEKPKEGTLVDRWNANSEGLTRNQYIEKYSKPVEP